MTLDCRSVRNSNPKEADERIRARHFSLRQLENMIRRGRLRDAKSIAGILYYAHFCRKPRHR